MSKAESMKFPPVTGNALRSLQAAIKRVPERYRQDAVQEAWLAHLEGRSPASAVAEYRRREQLHEQRETAMSQLPAAKRPL